MVRLGAISVLILGSIAAQQTVAAGEEIPLAPFAFVPSVSTRVDYDNNIFRWETTPQSDRIYAYMPSLLTSVAGDKTALGFNYSGTLSQHQRFVTEDVSDHAATARLKHITSEQLSTEVRAAYVRSHDARGASGSGSVPGKPLTTWDSAFGEALVTYHGEDLPQLKVSTRLAETRYNTVGTQWRNVQDMNLRLLGIYKLTGKTNFNVSADQRFLRHKMVAFEGLDASETTLSFGPDWSMTGKTVGSISLGFFSRDVRLGAASDYSGLYADISAKWFRKSYSVVTVSVNRNSKLGGIVGAEYYVQNAAVLSWNHVFTRRLSFIASGSGFVDDYASGRRDYLAKASASMGLQMWSWLKFTFEYRRSERRSTEIDKDFSVEIFSVGVNLVVR